MFENVLYQDRVLTRLKSDLAAAALPPAILFSGPAMSGKLTTAMELARALSCVNEAPWNCACVSCRVHRVLAHPQSLIAGPRELNSQIAASAEVLRRDRSDPPRFLLARSVRKLLRRFDPVLWEGDETKIAKSFALMERLAETVDHLLPGGVLPDGDALETTLDSLVDDCAALQKSLPRTLPVSQVRRITAWATYTAGQQHKTIIIDAADRMLDSALNALLKFLEEPPANTTAILICDRKSQLRPTLLSRLRDYAFRVRTPAEEAEILRRVFREDSAQWGGLAEYFRAWSSGPSQRMSQAAARFYEQAGRGDSDFPDMSAHIQDVGDLAIFLETLLTVARDNSKEVPPWEHRRLLAEARSMREAYFHAESLNLPILHVLRRLYIAMRSP